MSTPTDRVSVSGKFLRIGDETYYARGVTYGTFRADDTGLPYPRRNVVADDFALMASNGINAVRTYTTPPVWLLDEALDHGIRVMAGIPIGRYFSYLAGRNGSSDAADLVGRVVRERAGHPGVLCYAIGNELPAGIVRFHGRRYVERYLRSLYATAKQADPGSIITYGNYPSTEYLQLDFLDVVLFNVFLESPDRLSAYLARLQNIAGNRPLIIGELGYPHSLRPITSALLRHPLGGVRPYSPAFCAPSPQVPGVMRIGNRHGRRHQTVQTLSPCSVYA